MTKGAEANLETKDLKALQEKRFSEVPDKS